MFIAYGQKQELTLRGKEVFFLLVGELFVGLDARCQCSIVLGVSFYRCVWVCWLQELQNREAAKIIK